MIFSITAWDENQKALEVLREPLSYLCIMVWNQLFLIITIHSALKNRE